MKSAKYYHAVCRGSSQADVINFVRPDFQTSKQTNKGINRCFLVIEGIFKVRLLFLVPFLMETVVHDNL